MEQLLSETQTLISSSVKQCDGEVCIVSSRTGSVAFVGDVLDLYRDTFCSHVVKLTEQRFPVQSDSDPQHSAKATQELLKLKCRKKSVA